MPARWLRTVLVAFWRLRLWQRVALVVLGPIALLNVCVAFFGQSAVFPLSPFFLGEKLSALGQYARHRPTCLFHSHDDVSAIASLAEKQAGLPKGLMVAVVEIESRSKAHRISAAGAMGPAQLMPGTAKMLGVSDPFDPKESIPKAAKHLAHLKRRTGSVELAVAAYNAGLGNVSDGRVPKNGETRAYVAQVMRAYRGHH